MSLILAIETSSARSQIVIGEHGRVIFDSGPQNLYLSKTTLANSTLACLERVGRLPSDIENLAVNMGPGGLTQIRAGVSFVNALAFSSGQPIYSFNSFEIFALELREVPLPILCAIPGSKNHAFVSIVRHGKVQRPRFGPLPDVANEICRGLSHVGLAGPIRHRVSCGLTDLSFTDTGIEQPSGTALLELAHSAREESGAFTNQVIPINEQSEVFYDSASIDD